MAFRKLGHEAYSCDIQEPSGGHPEWHIQGDALELLPPGRLPDLAHDDQRRGIEFCTMDKAYHIVDHWDLLIAHPPCTYMANSGAVWMRVSGVIQEDRYRKAMEAKAFFMAFYNAPIARIAVENPIPMRLIGLPPYTQIVQPYEHGHAYSKATCLWLKGLPPLAPTEIIQKHTPYVNGGSKDAHGNYKCSRGKERDPKKRSKTFPGIARAMAEQWGGRANND